MARARWQGREEPFGADKSTGTMDPLQHATEAADVHEWEMSLRCAPHVWPLAKSRVALGRHVHGAANRMWRFDSEWPRSRGVLSAHGHKS
jgi:hypothetical protein